MPLLLLFFALLLALQQPETTNFTPENEFTNNCEGPSVGPDGSIYAVNIRQDGTIAHVTPQGRTSVFLTLPEGSVGNGIRFGDRNTFYVADFKKHNVLKVDVRTKQVSVHAHDDTMNQPNDLAITRRGHIYCSDPKWSDSTGRIWLVRPDGRTERVADKLGSTNGIEISPDERTLYVNESFQRNVWAFDLKPDGSLANKRLLIHFDTGGMDGMRCDTRGNLYVTRYGLGQIDVVSPTGKLVRSVKTRGLKTSNIAFGGPDGKTAYVTLQDRKCLETFRTDTPGREWQMMRQFR